MWVNITSPDAVDFNLLSESRKLAESEPRSLDGEIPVILTS
jgi:hypothetical protein